MALEASLKALYITKCVNMYVISRLSKYGNECKWKVYPLVFVNLNLNHILSVMILSLSEHWVHCSKKKKNSGWILEYPQQVSLKMDFEMLRWYNAYGK